MDLQSRPLDVTGMDLSAVGFGAWAAGGAGWAFGWGPQEDVQSVAALRHAVDLGVNWVDTAAVYGLGHSEQVVADAVRALPEDERPYVFTKCGLVWDPDRPQAPPRRNLRPESIRRECDASLRRLGVERIDLYQFHWPDPATPVEESWGTMQELIAEGKVRAAGVSNFTVDLLDRCERTAHVGALQPPLSLIRREAADDLLPWCADHDVGVIVYSPLQSGLLSGHFTRERAEALLLDDWRRDSPDFTEPALGANLALADALRPIARRHDVPPAVIAVAWALAWEGVTGAIVGARSPGQVDGWIGAANLRLTDAELDELAQAIERTGAGNGPRRPADLDQHALASPAEQRRREPHERGSDGAS